MPLSWLDLFSGGEYLGSTITTINATDTMKDSRAVINTNFTNLNAGKIENSTTSLPLITTISGLTTAGSLSTVGKIYQGSGVNATSTTGATTGFNATDLQSYSVIQLNPTIGDTTVSLPASSTLTTLVATAGQMGQIVIFNATTTPEIDLTLSAGSGSYLQTASTTLNINFGQMAVLNYIRKANTDIIFWLDN